MKIEINELIDIEETLEILRKLPDYRVTKEKIKHNQRDVLFGVLCSMFVDNIEIRDKHNWLEVNFNEKYFKRLIGKEDEELKVPSYSTVRRMLINIDSSILEEFFRDYFRHPSPHPNSIDTSIENKIDNTFPFKIKSTKKETF
jgi:NTP pyrophosphatase (non-canonical NTP hydrolase)